MSILRRTVIALGSMTLVALVIALAAPKATHGIVATLVQVANNNAQPVPTVATDNPAQHPVAISTSFIILPNNSSATGGFGDANGPYTVPAAKRLVAETISGFCDLPVGKKLANLRINLTTNGNAAKFYIAPITLMDTNICGWGCSDRYAFSVTGLKLYADPGTQLTMDGIWNPPGGNDGVGCNDIFLEGHLENIG